MILDWFGIVLDCGVYLLVVVFNEVFKNEGVLIIMEEVREFMGMYKRVYIRKVIEMEFVRRRWFEKFGRFFNEDDVERMF